jgi:hypothetical protein
MFTRITVTFSKALQLIEFITSRPKYNSVGRTSSIATGLLTTSLISLVLVIGATSCSSKTKPPLAASNPTQRSRETWPEKMQSLSKTLSSLLPLVASRTKFADPANQTKIESDTRSLSTLAHSLKSTDAPSSDPSLKMMSGLFEEDISRALDALRTGNRDYARHILRDTTSYCIQCHTQTNNGPQFPRLELGINTNELSPFEQAEFFSATRQFDRALESYKTALTSSDLAKDSPFEWQNAARSALAITVRVRSNAKETLSLIDDLLTNTALTNQTRKTALGWRKAVEEWKREPASGASNKQDVLRMADTLIKRASKNQEFPLDHTQDIAYFRASSMLHNLLQTLPQESLQNNTQTAQALYLAGVSSEATRDLNFWTLHETYFEQCIRAKPKSDIARRCFDRLKASITIGYSGSAGTMIPPDVARRLESFKQMAF